MGDRANLKFKDCNSINAFCYTGCPTDMLTSSDQILQFSNPHVSKSKTDFEKFR